MIGAYYGIATFLLGLLLFVLIMRSDGKYRKKEGTGKIAPILKLARIKGDLYRLEFSGPLTNFGGMLILLVGYGAIFALASAWDGDTNFPANLVLEPGLRYGSLFVIVALIVLRYNIVEWYEYDAQKRILFHRIKIRLTTWTGSIRTFRNVHHIAIRSSRTNSRTRNRDYQAVMALRDGSEVRIANEFDDRFYKRAMAQVRGRAHVLGLRCIDPPVGERPFFYS